MRAFLLLLLALPACFDPGGPTTPWHPVPDLGPACAAPPDYPPPPWSGAVGAVPRPDFISVGGTSVLQELHAPCAPQAQLLVVRAMAAWCGTCQEAARHTHELLGAAEGRVAVLDLVVLDDQNRPATAAALKPFSRFHDVPPTRLVVPDTWYYWLGHYGIASGVVLDSGLRFPLVVLLDRRTLVAQAVLGNPDPDTLFGEIRKILARLDGEPAPVVAPPALHDGRFTRDRLALIQAMALPAGGPPLDPTNRVELLPAAAALGRALFNDTALTAAGPLACASCHRKDLARQDGLPTSKGLSPAGLLVLGDRNAPSIVGAAYSRFQFWDGRSDSLWSQELGPFENDREFSSNRLHIVRTALLRHAAAYQQVFGPAPDLTGLPADGKPGQPAWDNLAPAEKQRINAAYANLGKALAAFERQIIPAPVAIDRYAAGDLSALTPQEKDGLLAFFDSGCAQCHHGPMLSDGAWHANYFPTGRQDGQADLGRLVGVEQLLSSPFRGDGPFSDDPGAATWLLGLQPLEEQLGQFRTQTLRGVADTAPYGHGGTLVDLTAVVDLYAAGGLPDGDPRTRGSRDLALVRFKKTMEDDRSRALVAFLKTFRAAVVDPD